MRPPVQISKFLAIEGAENRDAEGIEGRETDYGVRGTVVSSPSGVRGRSPGRKRVLEYLELEKTHMIVYQVCFFYIFRMYKNYFCEIMRPPDFRGPGSGEPPEP